MKKILLITCFLAVGLFVSNITKGQQHEIQQLLLNIEKLAQLKQILQDLKQSYQILSKGYSAIKELSEGNFNLHNDFLEALWQVNPVVKNYWKVQEIARYQRLLLSDYQVALRRLKNVDVFSIEELNYLEKVYEHLIGKAALHLDDLTMIVTPATLRMSDNERLEMIDDIYNQMRDMVNFFRSFNDQASMLALQRSKEKNNIETVSRLYGILD